MDLLKRDKPGAAAENMRALKHRGLSERDAVLVSMKNQKKKNQGEGGLKDPSLAVNDYPYGLRLSLDDAALDKLGMDLPDVGDVVDVVAKARVEEVSARSHRHDGRSEQHRRAELQITNMKVS